MRRKAIPLLAWSGASSVTVITSFIMELHSHQIKLIVICHVEGIQASRVVLGTGFPCSPLALRKSTNHLLFKQLTYLPIGFTKDVSSKL